MEKLKKSAYIGVNIVIYFLISYVILKYALGIILPFAISFLTVMLLRPIIDKMSRHTRVPKSIISLFVIGITLFVSVYLLILASSALLDQIGVIISKISEHLSKENNYISISLDFLNSLGEKFPFLKNNLSDNTSVYSIALDMAKNTINMISARLTQAIGRFIASMPEIVVTAVVILLSLFYFSKDYHKISGALTRALPSSLQERLPRLKKDIVFVISGYVRSYTLIILVAFAQVFAGLLILGVEGAFAIAIICAFVDALPILGVGVVLVPWSIVSFMIGNNRLGIGLLILFTIIYIVRQIIEPRIVSSQMNVHPLVAIISMYAGLKIAGVGGMIVAPFLAFGAKTVYDGLKKDDETKKCVENGESL